MITIKSFALVMTIAMSGCSILSTTQEQPPIPTTAPSKATGTPVSSSLTPTFKPYIIPLPLSTSINTPYATPVLLSPISPHESFDAYSWRLPSFENTLNLTILADSVKVEALDNDWYFIQLEARATNSSSKPLVLPKFLSAGWTDFHVVSFMVRFQEKELFTRLCCADESEYVSTEDFIFLQSGEFQNYSLGFILPTSTKNADGSKISLANKSITVSVAYRNDKVGFFNKFNNYQYTDVDAWIGEVLSDSIQIQLP